MSLALARKYRPKKFSDVLVQTHVANTLRGAIARGRVAHGYLLCGPRGTGKTTLARVLAMALNCPVRADIAKKTPQSPAASEPCGECESCVRIWSGVASLDVVEIDAASNRGVDDARDLRERAKYAPSGESRWKVYIIDEAHMLTREAWNALLKILEEPPPRVVFVFATTEPQKIAQFAAPVLSRLQRFDLKRIGGAQIRERLSSVMAAEGIEVEPDALALIARAADGSMRDALSLTDQVLALGEGTVTPERVRDTLGLVAEDEYIAMLDLIAQRRAGDVFGAVARLVEEGVDLGILLSGLGDILRAQLAVALGGSPGDVSERVKTALSERRQALEPGDLVRMLNALTELEPRFRRSTQQQLLLETMLVRFALFDRVVRIEELLRDLPEGGSAPAPGGPRVSRGTSGEPGERGEASRGSRSVASSPPSPPAPRLSDVAADRRGPRLSMPTPTAPWESVGTVTVERPYVLEPEVAATATAEVHIGDLNAIAAAWDDVVNDIRRERPFIASLLDHALPDGASASGLLTLVVESAPVHEALHAKLGDTVAALRPRIAGLQRIAVKGTATQASVEATPRMTVETVRSETLASLRKRDPVLASAIDTLDLDLAD